MRRRKQRNPLLMRIIVITIVAHLVALPVLAHFGAFKKIQQQFIVGEVKMVTLPPPPTVKPEEKKQAKAKAAEGESDGQEGEPHHCASAARRLQVEPEPAARCGGLGSGWRRRGRRRGGRGKRESGRAAHTQSRHHAAHHESDGIAQTGADRAQTGTQSRHDAQAKHADRQSDRAETGTQTGTQARTCACPTSAGLYRCRADVRAPTCRSR